VDPEHERAVAKDVDEALWEEVETRLRHQSRTTANYLLLMALGGAIAATGFAVHQPTEQALSFVAGAIVAPGFELLANASVGLALRRWALVARASGSAALGYLVLTLSAALLFVVLRLTGAVTVGGFVGNPGVESLAHPALRGVLVSACGALAGMVMLTTYRQYLLPGALIALRAIEAAALVGAALIAGEPALAYGALGRFLIGAVLILAAGVLAVGLKQAIVHRRKPMVTGSGRRAEIEMGRAKRAGLLATNAIRYRRSSSQNTPFHALGCIESCLGQTASHSAKSRRPPARSRRGPSPRSSPLPKAPPRPRPPSSRGCRPRRRGRTLAPAPGTDGPG